nr:hypothetical protein [Tanacetum cinerariifolium]
RARIAQSSALPTVADEPASPVRDNSQGEACPTDSGFIADQDRATIANNDSEEIARVLTSLDAANVLSGETNVPTGSGFIPTAAAERVSNDSEEIARVLTSLDAANVLSGETNVPTGSGSIPTAGPPATIVTTGSEVGPTASPIVQRRKGKEIMVESDTPKNVNNKVSNSGIERQQWEKFGLAVGNMPKGKNISVNNQKANLPYPYIHTCSCKIDMCEFVSPLLT